MCSPALTSDLEGKLADARQCVLKTQLKEIAFDILSFGRMRPYLDHVSTEAFQTALFKVLVSMVQTYIRVKVDCQNQVAVDGQEEQYCLSHVNVEAHGWRIKARRCIDNLELNLMARWAIVEAFRALRSTTPIFTGRDRCLHGNGSPLAKCHGAKLRTSPRGMQRMGQWRIQEPS
jgi:hypothetical protein